jgi:ankyrin repeat protein/peroxiredoxin
MLAAMPGYLCAQTEKELFYAIFDNDYNAVAGALNKGADIHALYQYERYKDECQHWSVAHVASAMGNLKILKFLVNKGADLKALVSPSNQEAPNSLASTLHIAAAYGNADIVQFLLDQGLPVNARAKNNRTPLVSAICDNNRNNLDVIKLLIEKGADINISHDEGNTPLYDAIWNDKFEVAKYLLDKGAPANHLIKDKRLGLSHSVSPLYAAIYRHHNRMLQVLYDHGASLQPDLPTHLLHWAVQNNNTYAVAFLLQRGLKADVEDNQGRLPIDLAKAQNNQRMVTLLQKGKLSDGERKIYDLLLSDKFKQFKTVERAAPNFVLKDLNNQSVVLENFRGKVVILNIWATWCPPCLREMPSFKKHLEKLKRPDVVVVTVSIDTKMEKVADYVAKNQYPFVLLHDPQDQLRKEYSGMVPSTFVIDKQGRIIASVDGSMDWSADEYINFIRLLAQEGGYW